MTTLAMQHTRITPGHVIGAAAASVLVLAIIAPMALTLLCVATAVGLATLRFLRTRRLIPLGRWVAWPIIGLVLYAGLTIAWSEKPVQTVQMWPLVASVFLAGLVLSSEVRRLGPDDWQFVRSSLLIGVLAGLLLFAVELAGKAGITFFLREITGTGGGPGPDQYTISWFNRAATITALLIWPFIMLSLSEGRRWLAVGAAAASAAVVGQTGGAAALAALTAGGVVYALTWLWPRALPYVCAALLGLGVILAPGIVRLGLAVPWVQSLAAKEESSAAHRLRIWDHAVDLISQKPVFGWGLDSARHLKSGGKGFADLMPLHPHNGALQIWLELGLVGAVIAALLAVATCIAIARVVPGRTQRAGSLAALASAVTIICLSYGIWQYWWLSGLCLAAALTLFAALGPPTGRAASTTPEAAGHAAA